MIDRERFTTSFDSVLKLVILKMVGNVSKTTNNTDLLKHSSNRSTNRFLLEDIFMPFHKRNRNV